MISPDQSTLDLTDDVEKARQAWMLTRKAVSIGATWRAGVEWGRAHPDSPMNAAERRPHRDIRVSDCSCEGCQLL